MSGECRGEKISCVALVLILFSAAQPGALGQTSRSQFQLEPAEDVRSRSATPASVVSQPAGVPLESTVDPHRYHIGPSDILAVNIWMSPPVSQILTVTPEGTLVVPTVGEIKLADITLAEAKARVMAEIRKKYVSAEATVTLVRPRPIIVSVVGYVFNPGSQTLTAADRANRAIELANTPLLSESPYAVPPRAERMSARSIIVKHRDGTQERADLPLYLATKDGRLNPYLREGDVVVVPEKDPEKNVFGIYGEVNLPGRYEYVEGDSVLDALHIAQGFTSLAITDSVLFTQMNAEGGVLSEGTVNLSAIADRKKPNFPLRPGDRVVVRTRLDMRRDYRVSVVGEVLYPGTYPITRNRTRLSEIIRQARGFTDYASLKSAELVRRSVLPTEIQLERLESLRGGVASEDSSYYYLETNLRIQKEIVNVDFERLFMHGDSTQDVVLQDEDRINVPSLRRTIYVFGQVVATGHVPYVEGERAEYYIQKAGGYTERARSGDIKIVKAKTRQWLSPKETTIEEGDYVWVPKEPERPFSYYMNIIGQTASIVGVAVSVVLLVIQTTK